MQYCPCRVFSYIHISLTRQIPQANETRRTGVTRLNFTFAFFHNSSHQIAACFQAIATTDEQRLDQFFGKYES